jgi:hypothetical protein
MDLLNKVKIQDLKLRLADTQKSKLADQLRLRDEIIDKARLIAAK